MTLSIGCMDRQVLFLVASLPARLSLCRLDKLPLPHAVSLSLRLAVAVVCIGLGILYAAGMLGLLDQPAKMALFFAGSGVVLYTLMIHRALRSIEVSSVVPDRVRDALDTLSEGLLVVDERDNIVLANDAFSRMVGIDRGDLIGRRACSLAWVSSEPLRGEDCPWQRAAHHGQPQIEQLMRYRLPDDSIRFFAINASSVQHGKSATCGAVATFRDVTLTEAYRAERERTLAILRTSRDEISSQNQELQILATQDALTGCLNRRALTSLFADLWRDAKQHQTPLSCLMIDNDYFKRVNDQYGHSVGDEVLRRVSEVLQDRFAEPALVCRYGGEEFCVILPNTPLEYAVKQAGELRQAIEDLRLADIESLRLTASVGVSETRFGASTPSGLIAQADESLYVAKASGRNRVVAFRN
ncbi:Response regulator PleD [Rubripirellula lacrimiformis]|uniref:diguanylate cyclase n=1 Tax=Rubripirellula lacrimiformis TaxID=1930273 RepID=A0A517NKJ5_9BACT|nr:diguanylate cyclase [Rubripirellula lacrimiformis]QDT07667.1 Response regulator PleD [Rubripirellula lacrimiformis]